MKVRYLAPLVAVAASLAAGVLFLEVAFRIVDHQPLTRLTLTAARATGSPIIPAGRQPDLKYVETTPLGPGVNRSWYGEQPQPRPEYGMDSDLVARAASYPDDPYTPFFEFNRQYLRQQICGGHGDVFGGLQDFFYFDPIDANTFPTFRHLRHASLPSWFVTNNFGWRGPDVDLNRPAGVIRIAFVGASTTSDSYGAPFSHPELIEPWLNEWARARGLPDRFEVINAGRTGIDSRSMEAIVRTELLPVDPDLVVFYGEANQFTPGSVLHTPLKQLFPKPPAAAREHTALDRNSALARRLLFAWDRFRGGNGEEPSKPPGVVTWPSGVNESDPDPYDRRLPMDLPRVVANLDGMRAALAPSGGELAVSSFIWLAHGGLKLDRQRHAGIYRYLNETFWPIPYAHIRRMADFQNRVLEQYARRTGAPFVDIAREFPPDPDLFEDPVHLNPAGLHLEAWEYFQHLVRMADERIAARRWPRPARSAQPVHPAFRDVTRRIMSRASVAAQCP
jgi:hypothetical protein